MAMNPMAGMGRPPAMGGMPSSMGAAPMSQAPSPQMGGGVAPSTGNVMQITSRLRGMPDAELQQYAAMHKNDPFVFPLAFQESKTRQQMRAGQAAQMAGQKQPPVVDQDLAQMTPTPITGGAGQAITGGHGQAINALPEEQGIGALNAPNLQNMADGGIVGYADGGQQPGMFNYAQMAPAVDLHPNSGVTPRSMAAGGITGQNYAERGLVNSTDRMAPFADKIREEAVKLGLDPEIAYRMFKAESGGDKNAVSPAGTEKGGYIGLGQMGVAASKDAGLDPKDRTNPDKSIPASLRYLKQQVDRHGGDYAKALASYNWGPGNLRTHMANNHGEFDPTSLPKETQNYLNKIMPVGAAQAGQTPVAVDSNVPTQKELTDASSPGFVTPSSGIGSRRLGTTGAGPLSNALASGQGQIQAALGAGDVPYNLLGLPMDVGHQITKVFGNKTPDENIFGSSAYLKKKATELGIRAPDSTDPTLGGFRTAGNLAASLYNPVSGVATAGGIADLNALRAAQTARAAEAEAKVALPRLPAPASSGKNLPPSALVGEMGADARVGTPAQMLPRTAENITADSARTGEQLNALQADREIAAAQEAAAAKLNAQKNPTQSVNPIGAASIAVNSGPAINSMLDKIRGSTASTTTPNYDAMTEEADREFGPKLQGTPTVPSISDITKTVTKPEGGRDWNDMLLNLGLGLMAGQSPYALQNLGTAGLGALKADREQKNQKLQDAYLQAKTLEATNASDPEWIKQMADLKREKFDPLSAYNQYILSHQKLAATPGAEVGALMSYPDFVRQFPMATSAPPSGANLRAK